ncbi:MAG: hypothetical protein ACKO8Q_06310, partial [Bacteroidota bacterium]
MKKSLSFFSVLLSVLFMQCSEPSNQNQPAVSNIPGSNESKAPDSAKDESSSENSKGSEVRQEYQYLLGAWTGTLRDKSLTLIIEKIEGNEITGYNVAGKNKRPISGTIMKINNSTDGAMGCEGCIRSHKLILKEPGDDKWDGFFTLYA